MAKRRVPRSDRPTFYPGAEAMQFVSLDPRVVLTPSSELLGSVRDSVAAALRLSREFLPLEPLPETLHRRNGAYGEWQGFRAVAKAVRDLADGIQRRFGVRDDPTARVIPRANLTIAENAALNVLWRAVDELSAWIEQNPIRDNKLPVLPAELWHRFRDGAERFLEAERRARETQLSKGVNGQDPPPADAGATARQTDRAAVGDATTIDGARTGPNPTVISLPNTQPDASLSAIRGRVLSLISEFDAILERFENGTREGLSKGLPGMLVPLFQQGVLEELEGYLSQLGLKPSGDRLSREYWAMHEESRQLYCATQVERGADRAVLESDLGTFEGPWDDPKIERTRRQFRCRILDGLAAKLRSFLVQLREQLAASRGGESFDGYASADTLQLEHGCVPARLSQAKHDGKIRWKNAPPGVRDSQGRHVRILYHEADAKKHATAKRICRKTR